MQVTLESMQECLLSMVSIMKRQSSQSQMCITESKSDPAYTSMLESKSACPRTSQTKRKSAHHPQTSTTEIKSTHFSASTKWGKNAPLSKHHWKVEVLIQVKYLGEQECSLPNEHHEKQSAHP